MNSRLRQAEEITALIPAAGRAPEGVMALSNIACPAMIPVAGRPVIHWTMSYLRSLGLRRFHIAVARRGMFVEDFVNFTFGQDCEIKFIVPPEGGGVGDTVTALIAGVETPAALVVLGDTHFQFAEASVLNTNDPFVLVHPVEDSYRWCIAETNADGTVSALRDKEPGLSGDLQALIGVYYFPSVKDLRAAADAEIAARHSATPPRDKNDKGRIELSDLLDRVRAEKPLRAIASGAWLDCGNPDRQASSHQALLQKRDFNELAIDPILGTITKRSRHNEKFIDEINFLRLLPNELAVLFPRVVDFSIDWNDPWVCMEYYGYPTLAEVFVFENVDPGIWEQIFTHLYEIITARFMRHRRPLPEGALNEMYLGKTRRRLEEMHAPAELLALVAHEGAVTVNGREMSNVASLWEDLEREIIELGQNVEGTIVHGDLCLSNILYDLRSRICKLIDPRGSFGATGIFGDPRYDVAKLYHSVYGLYDFITNDLFQVSLDGASIRLEMCARPQHRMIRERFEKVFFPRFDRREILLLTALLFASMPALHYDHPQRQLAMYARALELFDECFSLSSSDEREPPVEIKRPLAKVP